MENKVSNVEVKNAVIVDATITTEHQNALTALVTVTYGNGATQPFGGFLLLASGGTEAAALQTNSAGLFLSRVMAVAGVKKWGDLAGRSVRVRASDERIEAMGHIIADDWFDPVAELGAMKTRQLNAMPTKPLVSLLERVRDALPVEVPVEDVALASDVTEAIDKYGEKEGSTAV